MNVKHKFTFKAFRVSEAFLIYGFFLLKTTYRGLFIISLKKGGGGRGQKH